MKISARFLLLVIFLLVFFLISVEGVQVLCAIFTQETKTSLKVAIGLSDHLSKTPLKRRRNDEVG